MCRIVLQLCVAARAERRVWVYVSSTDCELRLELVRLSAETSCSSPEVSRLLKHPGIRR